MTRPEFERLRNLPGKRIHGDIVWGGPRDSRPNLIFDQVQIENTDGLDVAVNGTFKPDIPSVTFNFVLRGVGPICRIDVNGTIHGNAGRTHKHDLRRETDPRNNLPMAIARQDLEGLSPREIWEQLCQAANIHHNGMFHNPEEGE